MGGGQSEPYIAKNNLESNQKVEIIDLIGEGPLSTPEDPKRIYFGETPLQDENGSMNFKGVEVIANAGFPNQPFLPGFDKTKKSVSVNTELKYGKPIIRRVVDPLVDHLVLTLGVQGLVSTSDKGDQNTTSVHFIVEFSNQNGGYTYWGQLRIEGKTNQAFTRDVLIKELPPKPFNIRISRAEPDSENDKLRNKTFWGGYVEIIDSKLRYPHCAVVGLRLDSAQFGNNIPQRTYQVKGLEVDVPVNYNPTTREYDEARPWNGQFKKAWTDNPAWIFRDLVVNPRYGLGLSVGAMDVDRWALYNISKWCDEMVEDGEGGREPRVTCNVRIGDIRAAGDLLNDFASAFRGTIVWNGTTLVPVQDAVSDPVWRYTNSNVVNGRFDYQFVGRKAIFSVAHVDYIDKKDSYRRKTEYVADDYLLKRYGENIKRVTAFGCTSRGQALRLGKWILETSRYEQTTVAFTVGAEGALLLPFDIIQVDDKDFIGEVTAGRIMSIDGNRVTVDEPVNVTKGQEFTVGLRTYVVAKGATDTRVITLTAEPVLAELADIWTLKGRVATRLFRVINVESKEDGSFAVQAIEHHQNKHKRVDSYPSMREYTTHTVAPTIYNPTLTINGDTIEMDWGITSAGQLVQDYEVTLYQLIDNEKVAIDTQIKLGDPRVEIRNLSRGDYIVEVRARMRDGTKTKPISRSFSVDYDVRALEATPEVLSINLTWVVPEYNPSKLSTELRWSKGENVDEATGKILLPYPTNRFNLPVAAVTETRNFWARMVDERGVHGPWTEMVSGHPSLDPAPLVELLNGQLTESAFHQDLLAGISAATNVDEKIRTASEASTAALQAETAARVEALRLETQARNLEIQTVARNAADELRRSAQDLGTRIQRSEDSANNAARTVETLTSAQRDVVAALERETQARTEADRAETSARELLANRIGEAESHIDTVRRSAITREQIDNAISTSLRAAKQLPDTRNDNRPPSWYWQNHPKEVLNEFKSAAALGIAGGALGVLETTVPWDNHTGGAITQVFKMNDGSVKTRTSDVTARGNGTTGYSYTRDTWTEWKNSIDAAAVNQQIAAANRELATAQEAYARAQARDAATAAQAEAVRQAQAKVDGLKPKVDQAKAAADAAKAAADAAAAKATRLESEITTLQQTKVDAAQAEAIFSRSLRSAKQLPDTRNDNRPPSWYWQNHPKEVLNEFKSAAALGIAGGALGVLETTVPWDNHTGGAITQVFKMNDGSVKTRTSDVTARGNGTTGYSYTRDTWTEWKNSIDAAAVNQQIAAANRELATAQEAYARAQARDAATAAQAEAVRQAQAKVDGLKPKVDQAKAAADAAKAAADAAAAKATRLESEITTLQQTKVDAAQAEAIFSRSLRSAKQLPDTRNDNRPPSWYWQNHPKEVLNEFKSAAALGIAGGALGVLETTVPWDNHTGGAITQVFKMNDGSVKTRTSDVTARGNGTTGYSYTRDTWTEWKNSIDAAAVNQQIAAANRELATAQEAYARAQARDAATAAQAEAVRQAQAKVDGLKPKVDQAKAAADAAKAAADAAAAKATRLESEITTLQQTKVDAAQAEAIFSRSLRSAKQLPDTRNDNRPPSWYWQNHPKEVLNEFKSAAALGIAGGALGVLETTVPWDNHTGGAITQVFKMNDGSVKTRTSDVTARGNGTTGYSYTRDTWTEWKNSIDAAAVNQQIAAANRELATAQEAYARAQARDAATAAQAEAVRQAQAKVDGLKPKVDQAKAAADAAKAAADAAAAKATRLESEITTLQQTKVDAAQAEAIFSRSLRSAKQLPDTRNDNRPPSWYWQNHPKEVLNEFKSAAALGIAGGALGVLETTVPWDNHTGGAITQVFKMNDGSVKTRTSDVTARGNGTTGYSYTRDTWTEWKNSIDAAAVNQQIAAANRELATAQEAYARAQARDAATAAQAEAVRQAQAKVDGLKPKVDQAKAAADAAKAAADAAAAKATRLESEITTLQQTKVDAAQAEAIFSRSLRSAKQLPDTRNDNRPPSWYWQNHPKEVLNEFKSAAALGIAGGALGVLETTVPWDNHTGGAITQVFKMNDGSVKTRTSDVTARGNGTTGYSYTRDTWTEWKTSIDAETVGSMDARIQNNIRGVNATIHALQEKVTTNKAEIDTLKRTTVTEARAQAIADQVMSTRVKIRDTRNENREPSWYWTNSPRETVYEFKDVRRLGLTAADTTGFAQLETKVPWDDPSGGSIIQILIDKVGRVFKRTSNPSATRTGTTGNYRYQNDTWTAWVQDMDAAGVESKLAAAKRLSDERFATVEGSIRNLTTSITTANNQTNERLQTMTSTLGDMQSTVQQSARTVADISGKLSSTWSVKVETLQGNKQVVSGITLGSNPTGSDFIVNASKFSVYADASVKPVFTTVRVNNVNKLAINGDLIADGTIHGRHIVAGTTIQAPVIQGGSLNIGGGKFRVESDGSMTATNANVTGVINATGGVFRGKLEATDAVITGRFRANLLEAVGGKWYEFQDQTTFAGNTRREKYSITFPSDPVEVTARLKPLFAVVGGFDVTIKLNNVRVESHRIKPLQNPFTAPVNRDETQRFDYKLKSNVEQGPGGGNTGSSFTRKYKETFKMVGGVDVTVSSGVHYVHSDFAVVTFDPITLPANRINTLTVEVSDTPRFWQPISSLRDTVPTGLVPSKNDPVNITRRPGIGLNKSYRFPTFMTRGFLCGPSQGSWEFIATNKDPSTDRPPGSQTGPGSQSGPGGPRGRYSNPGNRAPFDPHNSGGGYNRRGPYDEELDDVYAKLRELDDRLTSTTNQTYCWRTLVYVETTYFHRLLLPSIPEMYRLMTNYHYSSTLNHLEGANTHHTIVGRDNPAIIKSSTQDLDVVEFPPHKVHIHTTLTS